MAKEVQLVQSKHIKLGIEKYEAKIDKHLQQLIRNAGYEYTPYLFKDGRLMLVLPNNLSALLYLNKEVLFRKLDLD